MKITTLEEFKESCDKKRCLRNTMYNNKTCLTDSKRERCYKQYLTKLEKDKIKREEQIAKSKNKVIKVDEAWLECKRIVKERDGNKCRFISICTPAEKKIILEKVFMFKDFQKLDPAHIYSQGAYKHMYVLPENVATLYRYVHTCIDQFLDPFTEEYIGKEGNIYYWKRIVGEDIYNELERRSRER